MTRVRGTPIMLEEKFRLVGEIGRGGMGLVFRAEDLSLDRLVAVKFLLPELVRDAELVERFHSEARAMASVRHPNVAQIYSFGWYGKTPYFVMEYAAGLTVDVLLEGARQRKNHIPLREALHIIDQAAAGLEAVHSAGVVHRDVKPGNLIAEPETGRVVIMDFGIGHRVDPDGKPDLFSVGGSPAYMAPEVISSESVVAEREHLIDIYALGISSFELLTGQLPCEFENWIEALTWHLVDQPVAPSSLRPGLPHGLDDVVLRCLEKDPTKRYQTAADYRAALRPFIIEMEQMPRERRAKMTPPQGFRTSQVVAKAWKPSIALVRPGPALRRMTRRALETMQVEAIVVSVETIGQATEMVRERRADVIVSRLHDPDLSGFELAAQVQKDQDLQHLELILTTDEEETGERVELERLGVAGLLTRPLSPHSLVAALRRALRVPRPNTVAAAG
jgi:eukaryotic-like serine/threonine-protein kinase